MAESILGSVKTALGLPADGTDFDGELIMYINSVFSTLRQLGVGEPVNGYAIQDATATWEDFFGGTSSAKFNDVKTYMAFRVKMMFDPPDTSYAIDAIKEQIQEFAFRINVSREETDWIDPDPVPVPDPVEPIF